MNLTTRVKGNPVVSTLIAVGILSGAVTGTIAGVGQIDDLVMTHAEHNSDVDRLDGAIMFAADEAEELKAWNKCDRLERRMDTLQDRIFRMQESETDAAQIREVQQDLAALERDFMALNCAVILAG